jgi:DNA-binding response OmpR family regulator
MKDKSKILLVEDDESLGYLLTEYLKMKDFQIQWCKKGSSALELLNKEIFDLILLDVMMPEMDGFTLASKIKQQFPEIPFIFLTSRSLKIDVLKGFSLGAIDYLKKPIDEEELVVRIRTLLNTIASIKYEKNISKSIFQIGKYDYDSTNFTLTYLNTIIRLTERENKLLYFLITRENEICSHKEILTTIWGKNDYFNKKSLNVFISRLRKYFQNDPSIKIENIHNKGFVLTITK